MQIRELLVQKLAQLTGLQTDCRLLQSPQEKACWSYLCGEESVLKDGLKEITKMLSHNALGALKAHPLPPVASTSIKENSSSMTDAISKYYLRPRFKSTVIHKYCVFYF